MPISNKNSFTSIPSESISSPSSPPTRPFSPLPFPPSNQPSLFSTRLASLLLTFAAPPRCAPKFSLRKKFKMLGNLDTENLKVEISNQSSVYASNGMDRLFKGSSIEFIL
ncbi:hypothetical protein ACET3Z_033031 [Daucus carota]